MSYTLLRRARVVSQRITGEANAKRVAARLVSASIEFHTEPLPDDVWDFTVKAGEGTIASQNFNCWQFYAPIVGDHTHGLFCDRQIDHDGPHNAAQRATYKLGENFGR